MVGTHDPYERYELAALVDFAGRLLMAEGLSADRAAVVARGFLEADLLGFGSHGLSKVEDNLTWLRNGETAVAGDPVVLIDKPALANWDGHRLPGHWVMHLAVRHAIERAQALGTFSMTLRRAQHVGCLASALIAVVEAELIALMMVSSPEEAFVSPFGGSQRLFSNNPVAFTAPTSTGPILFDVSMAITAGGQVDEAVRRGKKLPEAALKTVDGQLSDDPGEFRRGGSVMPVGGTYHGHKGHALTIMTEVLSQALGGYGRLQSSGESEQNSVFLQVFDPAAFGSRSDYDLEVDHLVSLIEASPADDASAPVRVPGRRAWLGRSRRIEQGVDIETGILNRLRPFAAAADVDLPEPQGSN